MTYLNGESKCFSMMVRICTPRSKTPKVWVVNFVGHLFVPSSSAHSPVWAKCSRAYGNKTPTTTVAWWTFFGMDDGCVEQSGLVHTVIIRGGTFVRTRSCDFCSNISSSTWDDKRKMGLDIKVPPKRRIGLALLRRERTTGFDGNRNR